MTQELPYGSWPSGLHADALTRQTVRLSEPQLTPGAIYWLEGRPSEAGRVVLLRMNRDGTVSEPLPQSASVRSRAHEYGGGSYCVAGDDIFYVEAEDQCIYHVQSGQPPRALTPAGACRYADLCFDPQRQRLLAVCEDHSDSDAEPINSLVAIPLYAPDGVRILEQGRDFYSNPTLSADGRQLAWLSWDHPHMPWDSSECWLADLHSDGQTGEPQRVAGGEGESVFQPQWSPGGVLYLVSDHTGWWNIYRADHNLIIPVAPMDAEFATPQWVFGMSTYGFLSETEILACASSAGSWQLLHLDLTNGNTTALQVPCSDISQIRCCDGGAILLGANWESDTALYRLRLANAEAAQIDQLDVVARSSTQRLPAAAISRARAVSFASGNGDTAHGFYYPPHNPHFRAPPDSKPPLIVLCHGGPTGATETGLNLKIQYWTSRGFAVMDVNYRGSTGYGRAYREQLQGGWGICDVEDVCAAARHIMERGLADPDKLIIKGGSAGGYTALAALAFADTFRLGVSLYGIGDLETLARDTHKFESRYLDSLVGPWPAERDTYLQRSPIHHADRLNCPVLFFQGAEDKVVPPQQAEAMVQALDNKGIPVAYISFEQEGHGFRRADSIQRCLEAEWSFYCQLLGLDAPAGIEPVRIRNL